MTKLTLTHQQHQHLGHCLQAGWATIGSRIEDYNITWSQAGWQAARAEIYQDYGMENGAEVFRGLRVFRILGCEGYYSSKRTAEIYNIFNTK